MGVFLGLAIGYQPTTININGAAVREVPPSYIAPQEKATPPLKYPKNITPV